MSRHPAVSSPALAIFTGGSMAGALDITYAIIFSISQGFPAMSLLQFVASGLLGKAAYDGGTTTAALGLALHFFMAYVIASLFYITSRHLKVLTTRPIICGLLFGIIVFFVMKLVVLPLSAFPNPITFKPLSTITNLLSHMFLFGLPISLATRKFSAIQDN